MKIIGIYGLAKNTGKTVSLNVLIEELHSQGLVLGVTSIGRDGEEFDVINQAILKPRISVPAQTLVATTQYLLNKSGLSNVLLAKTSYVTPLGRVVVARLLQAGTLEIAGPSIGEQVKQVSDMMLVFGADKVLVDGAINRRSASSPEVTDSIIIATGAVLDENLDQVVQETVDTVERVNIEQINQADILVAIDNNPGSFAITKDNLVVNLEEGFALAERLDELLSITQQFGPINHIIVRGAICEPFLASVLACTKGRDVTVISNDSSKFYLERHGVHWYRRQGIHLRVLKKTVLSTIVVNPVAPMAYSFCSVELRQKLQAKLTNTPIYDVMHASYRQMMCVDDGNLTLVHKDKERQL